MEIQTGTVRHHAPHRKRTLGPLTLVRVAAGLGLVLDAEPGSGSGPNGTTAQPGHHRARPYRRSGSDRPAASRHRRARARLPPRKTGAPAPLIIMLTGRPRPRSRRAIVFYSGPSGRQTIGATQQLYTVQTRPCVAVGVDETVMNRTRRGRRRYVTVMTVLAGGGVVESQRCRRSGPGGPWPAAGHQRGPLPQGVA
jgi:hypothetical protein